MEPKSESNITISDQEKSIKEELPLAKDGKIQLDMLAKSLALSMNNISVQALLQSEIKSVNTSEKILNLSNFARKAIGEKTIAEILASYVPSSNKNKILEVIDGYPPMLDIYFPVETHRDTWTKNRGSLLVTYVPYWIDDKKLETVTAYSISGEKIILDAKVPPVEPVLVISVCEHQGFHPQDESMNQIQLFEKGLGMLLPAHNWGDKEILYNIIIFNDHEPWLRGEPEIYASWGFEKAVGVRGKYYMNSGSIDVNDVNKWYTINGTLFRWYSSYGDVFGIAIYEQDEGTTKIGITIGGKTYAIEYKDGDDPLGSTVVNFNDPYHDLYDTGDARWHMRFAL